MKKEEQKIPSLIQSKDYLKQVIGNHLSEIVQDADHIATIKSYFIKKHADEDFFHFVVQNNLTIVTKGGLRKRFKIFCVTFSGHGRRKMFEVMRLACENGFAVGEIIVPRPLWYSEELMSAFYVGVPGENFLEHIKNGYLVASHIKKIAAGLARFHKINVPKNIKLSKHKFSIEFLDPTDIINESHNKNTELVREVKAQFTILKKLQKQLIKDNYCLSHGDFHPENIIINQFNSECLAIIDFSESCYAPIYFDIGSFLQQLQFMTKNYLNKEELNNLESDFLESYCKSANMVFDKNMASKINLYKSWTALKSTVYFMIFNDDVNHNFAHHLVEQSKYFSDKIKK